MCSITSSQKQRNEISTRFVVLFLAYKMLSIDRNHLKLAIQYQNLGTAYTTGSVTEYLNTASWRLLWVFYVIDFSCCGAKQITLLELLPLNLGTTICIMY